jgi:hypothetical protein
MWHSEPMLNPSDITQAAISLPLLARMELFDSIEESLERDYAALAGFGEHGQEALMEQRLADVLSGKLETQPLRAALDDIRKTL